MALVGVLVSLSGITSFHIYVYMGILTCIMYIFLVNIKYTILQDLNKNPYLYRLLQIELDRSICAHIFWTLGTCIWSMNPYIQKFQAHVSFICINITRLYSKNVTANLYFKGKCEPSHFLLYFLSRWSHFPLYKHCNGFLTYIDIWHKAGETNSYSVNRSLTFPRM